jgi:hypothetical protein
MLWNLAASLLTGGFGKFADTYRDVRIAALTNETATNTVVQNLELSRLKNEDAARQSAKEIRLATADFWEMRLAVALVAIPTALHYAAIVFDSIYNLGWNVQPLPAPFDEWGGIILLSPFGYGTLKSGINATAAILLKRKG